MTININELTGEQFIQSATGHSGGAAERDSFNKTSGGSPPQLGMTWREFKKQEFTEARQIIFGLRKGNVGLLIAETHVGKTTLALNIALTLAANGTLQPLITEHLGGLRVMYIDGESTPSETQKDIARMMSDWTSEETAPVDDNLLVLCDEELYDQSLNLSEHIDNIKDVAKRFSPDLIIVDTLSALFSLHDENSNAEMKKTVMQPLRDLARESNSVVLLLHHIGKTKGEEGNSASTAYRGRGASTLGCLARSVIVLRCPNKADKERVVLSVPKAKGYFLEDVMMQLDRSSRWFTATNEAVPTTVTCAEEVVSFVRETTTTGDVVRALSEKYGRRTVEDALQKAERQGRLRHPRQGIWEPLETTESAPPYEESGTVEVELVQ